MRRWPFIAASYVGAVVGAGFGSGRELVHFFAVHGSRGLLGAVLAGALFMWCGVAVLHRATVEGARHHGDLLRAICGPVLGRAMDHLMTGFLFLTVASVLAGAGALSLTWGWARGWGVAGLAVALIATAAWGQRGHLAVNGVLVPLLGALTLWASVRAVLQHGPRALLGSAAWQSAPAQTWWVAAILYVAYNLVLALAGLCAAVDPGTDPADSTYGGVAGGAALGLLCVALCAALLGLGAGSLRMELPLRAAFPHPGLEAVAFPACLGAALWTTGTAALSAIRLRLPRRFAFPTAAACVLLALPLGFAGLFWVVRVVYPLMGYAGLPLLVCLLFDGMRRPARRRPMM